MNAAQTSSFQPVAARQAQPPMRNPIGWAWVTDVIELSIAGDQGPAKRESDAGVEEFKFSLPAVISCQKGLAEPRYAGLKGIMAAKKKPIAEEAFDDVPSAARVEKLELPPPRPEGRIVGEGPDAVDALMDALRNEAKAL